MINIKLPDFSGLSPEEKDILNLVKYRELIRSNLLYKDFKMKPEVLEFRKKHPELGVFLYTNYLCEQTNFGNRSGNTRNGSYEEQKMGILAQNIVAMYLKNPVLDEFSGFDGGFDYVVEDKKIDLKTVGRKCDLNMEYAHNLMGEQLKYDCDFYLCASFNKKDNLLQISALVPKEAVKLFWKHYDSKTKSYNAVGKEIGGTDRYEVADYLLNADWQVNTFDDIHKIAKQDWDDVDYLIFGTDTGDLAKCICEAEKGDKQAIADLEQYKREHLAEKIDKSTIKVFALDFYNKQYSLQERLSLIEDANKIIDKTKKNYMNDRFDKFKNYNL